MCSPPFVRPTDVISTAALHTGSANFNRRPTHGHIDGGATPGGRTELITKCRSSLAHPLYSTFEFNPLSSLPRSLSLPPLILIPLHTYCGGPAFLRVHCIHTPTVAMVVSLLSINNDGLERLEGECSSVIAIRIKITKKASAVDDRPSRIE